MSATDSMEPRELLNALLDGELSGEDERVVRRWLDGDEEGRQELEALTEVRAMVRGLPAVEPPAGFLERLLVDADAPTLDDQAMLAGDPTPVVGGRSSNVAPLSAAPSRRRRSMTGAGIAAVAAIAAAFVLVLGVTPVTDKVVPPVQAFADRHDSMMASPPAAPFVGSEYQPVPAAELDRMSAPFMAPAKVGDFARQSGYRQNDVVHVVYTNGGTTVSVYEQRGAVDWSSIPASGQRHAIGSTKAWETRMGSEEVMVLELDGMIVTVVANASADQMMAMAKSVPAPPETSMIDRASHNCSKLVRAFTGGS